MNTATHPVAPEEVMAFLDGELAPAEAQAVSTHLDQCADCADLAGRLRATSESLARWTVPPVPASLEEAVMNEASYVAAGRIPAKPRPRFSTGRWGWKQWALGGGGALAAAVVLLVVSSAILSRPVRQAARSVEPAEEARTEAYYQPQPTDSAAPMPTQSAGLAQMGALKSPALAQAAKASAEGRAGGGGAPLPTLQAAAAPMIARTVSLTIVVKDFAAARASLDSILARHRGYAAQLTAATAENAPRSLQASLRIPAPELTTALAELKTLGRVQNESQSGEEVTQQHADLAARLQNSRETEERLRAILAQRTGKIEDVLQVEEEIARVRGEIEQMEAEQQALEHRVDFASVDLQLTEEYKAELNSPSGSVSNRLRNAFVAGVSNAAETILGIVLFLEEDGPVLVIWLAILGLPVFLLVRRYRRIRAKL
jgi:anti-sigma factor RsiW